MIATASSEDKRALTLKLGADAAVDVTREDLADGLREANEGKPVDVVFEMAGGRVFDESLNALAPFGRLVVYGIASRQPNEVASGALMRKRRAVVGFWLMHCLARPQEMVVEPLHDLMVRVTHDELRIVEGEVFGLRRPAGRTRSSRPRRTTGKLLLDPSR